MGFRNVNPPFPPPTPQPGAPPIRPLTNLEFLLFLLADLLGAFRGVPVVELLLVFIALALFGRVLV